MRIMENVEILSIIGNQGLNSDAIHPVVVWDDQNVVMFDTGFPNMETQIVEMAKEAGVPIERLSKIMITHSDLDHIGCLSKLKSSSTSIWCHVNEKPFLECDVPPVRLAAMENAIPFLEGKRKIQLQTIFNALKANYRNLKVKVTETFESDIRISDCGGIQCLFTPGHTTGHTAYYLEDSKLLIAGDILRIVNERITTCDEQLILDKEAYKASLLKLTQYQMDSILCFHGGYMAGNISEMIKSLLKTMAF